MKNKVSFSSFEDLVFHLVREENQKVKKPDRPRRVFRLLVPLSPLAAGKKFSALMLSTNVLISDKDLMNQLLWETCFRGIQTKDWLVLFELVLKISKNLGSRHLLPSVLGILYESSPRGGTWFSNHPPLRKSTLLNKEILLDNEVTTLLKSITSKLDLTKPKVFIDIVCEEIVVQKPKAQELVFIGKGYKDKGNLGDPGGLKPGEVPLSVYDFLSLSFDDEKEQYFSEALKEYLDLKRKFKDF